jgi:uncharacterized protein
LKILIDTNIWISYLIGKTLAQLKEVIDNPKIEIIVTDELISEIAETFERKHLVKYFKNDKFTDFWDYLNNISLNIKIDNIPDICRDVDDNYLLALADQTDCDFIITGDKDLLVLEQYKGVKILRFRDFITGYYEK